MNFILDFIIWSPDPDVFVIPVVNHPVRWYGVLFALGFIISQQIMIRIFKAEGRPEKDVDKLTTYMVVATILGARLGHCLFYNPVHYLSNPFEIIKIWEGGLASHGGALGIIIAIWLFGRKYSQYQMLWTLDRLAIVVAITGALIRTGNFINSEIEGKRTNSDFGVVYAGFTESVLNYDRDRIHSVTFEQGGDMQSDEPGKHPITAKITYNRGVKLGQDDKVYFENNLKNMLTRYQEVVEHIDFGGSAPLAYKFDEEDGRAVAEVYGLGISRHAAQLYEAVYCLILALIMYWFWHKKRSTLPQGFLFAFWMATLWSLRFVDEFFKMNQEAFEDDLILNMGQILSIPLALLGYVMMIYLLKKGRLTMSGEQRGE